MRLGLAAYALAAICLAAPAQAALIRADLFAPGDGLLTVDTHSGLEWLDVDQTVGLTFSQVVDEGAGGWIELGFRHANAAEISGLFAAAGIATLAAQLEAQNLAGAQLLLDLLGCTSGCGSSAASQTGIGARTAVFIDNQVFFGNDFGTVMVDEASGTGRAETNPPIAFGGFDFLGGRSVFVTGGLETVVVHGIAGPNFLEEFALLSETYFSDSQDRAFPGVGHYLVRAVPEPTTALLLGLGLGALAFAQRRSGRVTDRRDESGVIEYRNQEVSLRIRQARRSGPDPGAEKFAGTAKRAEAIVPIAGSDPIGIYPLP